MNVRMLIIITIYQVPTTMSQALYRKLYIPCPFAVINFLQAILFNKLILISLMIISSMY